MENHLDQASTKFGGRFFGQGKFEMPIGHQSVDIKQAIKYASK